MRFRIENHWSSYLKRSDGIYDGVVIEGGDRSRLRNLIVTLIDSIDIPIGDKDSVLDLMLIEEVIVILNVRKGSVSVSQWHTFIGLAIGAKHVSA